jgi:LAO/AO transport system kinase
MKPPFTTVEEYVAGITTGDRFVLSRAITLIESQAPLDEKSAQEVLQRILPRTGKSKRVGITGVPGVGKSTFIEALGCWLVEQGHSVAVLTIDPSSKRSGGSILGDKTRMERLSRESRAFIRPSPAGDNVGGVARRTRETMLLCEAAGFEVVLVESVGVGQSETTLRSMVDYFLLLLLPGAGDELQGIKRGIIEMADDILINKADQNRERAAQARVEQQTALAFMPAATPGWKTQVAVCSAQTAEGVAEAWRRVEQFYGDMETNGTIARRRQQQAVEWLSDLIRDELQRRFDQNPRVQVLLPSLRESVARGETPVVAAARSLLADFDAASKQATL